MAGTRLHQAGHDAFVSRPTLPEFKTGPTNA